jgi:uncharacterized protein (DUF169 family)
VDVETIENLRKTTDGRWYGVSFFADAHDAPENVEVKPAARFCEALKMAAVEKMLIRPAALTCPGACYAFGGMVDLKETIIDKMATAKGHEPEHALSLFETTPHFQTMPEMIGFDVSDEPDVIVARLQPQQLMRLVQRYHVKLNRVFQTSISSVISACGNTVVRAFQQQDLAISFGCDDSRTFGGLTQDRLYVGLPYALAKKLTKN